MFHKRLVSSCSMTFLAGMVSMAMSATAAPTDPVSDLGASWPNAPDLSTSPSWHVYVYQRDNVEYVQINDATGIVHAAFATANGQVLVLPMGLDSSRVNATQQLTQRSLGEPVYRDSQVQVEMMPQQSGAVSWVVHSGNAAIRPIALGCSKRECSGITANQAGE